MIDILIDQACLRRLRREMVLAGSREIGGVMAGEDLGDGHFRIMAASVQRDGGSFSTFVRDPSAHRRFMRRFLARTGGDWERFNYIGEWHSHPSFAPFPSRTDMSQMQRLIEDPEQIARFLVLLILKVGRAGGVEGSAHAFRRGHRPLPLPVLGAHSISVDDFGRIAP